MNLHPHAAGLFLIADPRWREKVFRGGLLLLLVPPLGWPAVMGYRKEVVRHLLGDRPEPLPSWEGRFGVHLREGLKALGVIFGYFAPLYAALAWLVSTRGFTPDMSTLYVALFFLAFPIFSTLSFPAACVILAHGPEQAWLRPSELVGLLAAYALTVFLLPAGFLRVSLTGRHVSAFALWRTVPFVLRNFRLYVRAWWCSGLMSLLGHLALPFSPWGVVWAYGGILFLFNEILRTNGLVASQTGMARALADPRFQGLGRGGFTRLQDGTGAPVDVLDLRLFSVPLPRLAARWLGRGTQDLAGS